MSLPRACVVVLLVCVATVSIAIGQTAPATATAPADAAALTAKVIEVVGTVEYAPLGAEVSDTSAWKPVSVDLRLGADTQIRTSLRSQCVLMFGEAPNETVIAIRRATLASISDFYRTESEQRVRLGLGYGVVRGGSSEGTLRSDVIIDSTVATLAKRGTQGYEIEVEPMSGYYRISLAESGLVFATSKATGQGKSVKPGEYADRENIARLWINQDIFNRLVRFYEVESVTESELDFMIHQPTGITSLAPDGRGLLDMTARRGFDVDFNVPPGFNPEVLRLLQFLVIEQPLVNRPEGNFGFGPTLRILAPQDNAVALRSSLTEGRRLATSGLLRAPRTHRPGLTRD